MDFQELQNRLRLAWEAFRAEPEEAERRSAIGETPAERKRQAEQLREDAWTVDVEIRHGEPDNAAERIPAQREWERHERPALLRELATAPITDETRDLIEGGAAFLMAVSRRGRES